MKHLISFLCICLLAGCAPVTQRPTIDDKAVAEETRKQRLLVLQELLDDQARLNRVAYPILARAAPLCDGKIRASIGAQVSSAQDLPKDFRESAAGLGLGNALQVIQVIAGTPAQRAGVLEKDIVLGVEGTPAPAGEGARAKLDTLLEDLAKTRQTLNFRLRRAGAEIVLPVAHEPTCDYPVQLNPAEAINAFATGRQIVIMRGMLRFARDDLELALVVGHELAHNTMKHVEKQKGNVMLGSLLDILAATRGVNTQGAFGNLAGLVYSKDFEAEADYVGLYFTARAGYDIEKAPNFWRRMASANPGSIQQRGFGASHPSTPERFVALEKIVEEIQAKKAAGKDLTPQLQKPPA